MWSLDFPKEYNDQNKVDPVDLFDAPTMHYEDPRPRMSAHLASEAGGAAALSGASALDAPITAARSARHRAAGARGRRGGANGRGRQGQQG